MSDFNPTFPAKIRDELISIWYTIKACDVSGLRKKIEAKDR